MLRKAVVLGAMKKRLFLCASLLVLGFSPVAAQTAGPGVAVVSLVQMTRTYKAVVTREDGKTEVLEIPMGASDKNLTATSQAYQKLIAQLYREGYALQNTFGGEGRLNLVFVKGQ
jgi:Skp family chaperone for outer membrane proteins